MGSIFLAMLAILTPAYSTSNYIEQLATLPAGSVVYVPTKGGVPLVRSVGGND
jgi:hypothetical protein